MIEADQRKASISLGILLVLCLALVASLFAVQQAFAAEGSLSTSYKVTFVDEGQSSAPVTQTVKSGKTASKPTNTPVKNDEVFDG